MKKKFLILMIGIMLIAMPFLFMILGENTASAMIASTMILIMAIMVGIYLLAMFFLMKNKKGSDMHHMNGHPEGYNMSNHKNDSKNM
jgi:hypothetical protein